MNTKTNNEWEKRLEEFGKSLWLLGYYNSQIPGFIPKEYLKKIRDFISTELSSERQRLIKEIKSKNINGVHFLDNQVDALLKLLEG